MLPAFALRYKAIVLAATALALAFGIVRFVTLPRSEDPEFRSIWATIVTGWPGATAEDIENLVSDPIEQAVSDLDEVASVVSLNAVGQSFINVTLAEGTADTDGAWDKVRAQVARVRLPHGTSPPYIDSRFADTAAMVLAIHQLVPDGRNDVRYSPRDLEIYAEQFKDRLLQLDAIARVELFGVQREAVFLETDADNWNRIALMIGDLENLLQARNIVAPGGSVDTDSIRLSVKPTGSFSGVGELEHVPVAAAPSAGNQSAGSRSGGGIYAGATTLGDLGVRSRRAYEDPPSLLARVTVAAGNVNSEPCIALSLMMKDGHNIVDLGQAVRRVIAEARATTLPADIDIAVIGDQPQTVRRKIGEFVDNLWQAILIVVVVACVMVGFRAAAVMAGSIPLVMLVAIGVSSLFDVHIEVVSLAALIIALGMLVDCAIEVADNVQHHLHDGASREEATVAGTQQIAFPVLIGALTTIAAFLPMLMIQGTTGEYIYSLPVVVSITLAVSWVIAMTVTALMSYWIIRPSHRRTPLAWVGDTVRAGLLGIYRTVFRSSQSVESTGDGDSVYTRMCRFCVNHQLIALAVPTVLLGVAGWLFVTQRVGTQFFPASDRAQFVIDVYLPEGAAIDRTAEVCGRVETLVRALADDGSETGRLNSMAAYVGQGGPRFYGTLDPVPPGSNYAQIVVNTSDRLQVVPYLEAIRRAVQTGIPESHIPPIADARVVPRKLDMGPPVDAPIEVLVFGPEISELRRIGEELKTVLEETNGTLDVHDSWGNTGCQLTVDIDANKAAVAGVTNFSIARTLNAYYSGHPLTVFREGDRQIPVYLRLPPDGRNALPDPARVFVEGRQGKVPLESVASLRYEWKPVKIRRENRTRVMHVRCGVFEGRLPNAVLSSAMPRIQSVGDQLPAGYRMEIGGEQAETTKGQNATLASSAFSVGLILLLLVVQYNSFTKPIIILITLPLAAAGSIFGLYCTGQPLGFMAGLGLLSLIGIVINDGIVLIEFVEILLQRRIQSGDGIAAPGDRSYVGLTRDVFRETVVRAGTQRLLPIMLTTLTTVGGLIPLALSGGPLFEPLATVLISGLLLGVFVMLLSLPAIYCLFVERFGIEVFPSHALDGISAGS